MNIKFKVRIYAMFQYFTFLALILMVLGIAVAMINASFHGASNDWSFWGDELNKIFSFSTKEAASLIGSVLVYIGMILFVLTWALGWTLFMFKDRNFYDQLFLLFVCIPFFSNLFALLAQLTLNTHKFTNAKLAKEDIEQEKTKIINLFEAKKRKLQKEIALHENELVKVEATLDSTPDIMLKVEKDAVGKKHSKVVDVKKTTIKVEPKEETKKVVKAKPKAKPAAKKAAAPKKAAVAKKPVAKKVAPKKAAPKAKKAPAKKK